MLAVIRAGFLSTVQDLGRRGHQHLGVSPSGALDRAALRLANRLIGNGAGAAGIEIVLGGFEAVFEDDRWFSVTGAWGKTRLDGTPVDQNHAVRAVAGQTLTFAQAEHGMRYYLAVHGGIAVPAVLGSRSTDVLGGLGPAQLADGVSLPLGSSDARIPTNDIAPWSAPDDATVVIALAPGPRADWFTPESLDALFNREWRLNAASNRVGARLDGTPLVRCRDGELPSEGMVAGAIQVPPGGLPTVLLADHPATGGYPVIAVVADASLDRFAQLRPGQAIRFTHAR